MNSSVREAGLQIVPSISTIREAQRFLAKYFAPTRLIAAPFLSTMAGRNIHLKLETELPTGSFKVRGALWALARRLMQGPVQEVVACSTGNHGAAVAYAAKQSGIKAKIFLPANCNLVKRGRIAGRGDCGERRWRSGVCVCSGCGVREPAGCAFSERCDRRGFAGRSRDDWVRNPGAASGDQRSCCADGGYGADSRDRGGGETNRAASEDHRRAGGARSCLLPFLEERQSSGHLNVRNDCRWAGDTCDRGGECMPW